MINEEMLASVTQMLEKGDYEKAFLELLDIYGKCDNGDEKNTVLSIIGDVFYAPNEAALKANYEKNLELLNSYPFVWGTPLPSFEELPVTICPIDNGLYYFCGKEQSEEFCKYEPESGKYMRYFFENVEKQLQIYDEDNLYNLMFLNDNVRKSEDIAEDNHIYLMYSSAEPLERLMLVCELEAVLQQQKFVFLIGEENFAEYPVDFKTDFDIDYSQNTQKEIELDNIKRIIFGWKTMNVAGTSFLADIMDFHPDLLTVPDCLLQMGFPVRFREQLIGKSTNEAISFLRSLSDKDERKSWVLQLLSGDEDIGLKAIPTGRFFDVLTNVLKDTPNPTPKEWLTAIYLAFSRCRRREFNGRIIPALFVYPHDDLFYLAGLARDQLDMYFNIVLDFPYHKVVTCVRDPITHAGSTIQFMTKTHKDAVNENGEIQRDPFYCFAFGCFLPKDIFFITQHPLYPDMRVVRFEDLKLNPEATLSSLTEFLNIPLTPSLYKTTFCGVSNKGWSTSGELFEGFDPKPIFNEHNNYLSIFDKYRIELALAKEYEIYGYKPIYYDGQKFTDDEKMKIMELPYLCETMKTVVSPEDLRAGRIAGINFIKFRLEIKRFPFTMSGISGDIAPIPWLRPKEELLRVPLYTNRIEATAVRSEIYE